MASVAAIILSKPRVQPEVRNMAREHVLTQTARFTDLRSYGTSPYNVQGTMTGRFSSSGSIQVRDRRQYATK